MLYSGPPFSQCTLLDLQEFDRVFALQYRVLTKDSTTSQHDTRFQPRAQGGMGFPRFSHMIIERKLTLLRRALSMNDCRIHTPAWLPGPLGECNTCRHLSPSRILDHQRHRIFALRRHLYCYRPEPPSAPFPGLPILRAVAPRAFAF